MYRRSGRGRVLLLVLLALCVLLITLDFRQNDGGFINKAKDVSAAVVDPVQRGFAAVFRPIGNFISSIGEIGNLRDENRELETEVQTLREQAREAESVLDENEELRRIAGLDESWATMERLTAEVIYKPPSNYRWFVVVNKGTIDGIRKDMAVVTPDGLVGRIFEVESRSSTVLLLIDPQSGVGAKVENLDVNGVVTGNGAGEPLSMDYVDIDAPTEEEHQVLTSSFDDSIFPPNIPIGQIISVEGDSAATEQIIGIRPNVRFTSLEFVQILMESGSRLTSAEDEGDGR